MSLLGYVKTDDLLIVVRVVQISIVLLVKKRTMRSRFASMD